MPARIPILDLRPEIDAHWSGYTKAIEAVMRSGQFINGPEVALFEKEIAAYLGVKHAISVNSGTDALIIGLLALGIRPGDEVITTPFSFFATAEAISLIGAKPVFSDIEPGSFNLDPGLIESKITEKTRAIMPVHLFGQPADLNPLLELAKKYSLLVLEDAAQAIGAEYAGRKVGSFGQAAMFSFFPSKNLGAFGDGGLIVTSDEAVDSEARRLRNHGSQKRYHHDRLGYCSRLDEIQAAILRVKLPHLEKRNELRRKAAERYDALLSKNSLLRTPVFHPKALPVFHQYTIRIENGLRDMAFQRLSEHGISSMIYYPIPIHRSPVYATEPRDLPHTERAAQEVLSLPIWPEIQPETQVEISKALLEVLKA